MIRIKLQAVKEAHEFATGIAVDWQDVASGTKMSRQTISKMLQVPSPTVDLDNINRLCNYFGCRIEALLEHVPDAEMPPARVVGRAASKKKAKRE